MIDRQKLLADLKPLLKEMEADLRARCDEVSQIDADLKKEYEQARAADRTGATYEEWRADLITQVAVAWVLSCVFVRFLEDNALIAPPRVSGPLHGAGTGAGLQRARDERETYFKTHPKQTDRDYLLAAFDAVAKLPGAKDVFGPHNPALAPAYRNWLSGDAAQTLIEFFQKIDTDGTGDMIHDFTDELKGSQGGGWDTRFLGDLYQDLSEAARKKYALLQTPVFVEEFILDRTLEPAIKEFGLKDFRMIDPACGSGHFLLGSFARLLRHWRRKEPALNDREHVNRVLASVHGVDLNPYAVAITRFRLLIAVLRECRITKLSDAPAFTFNLVCGDSLLHGKSMQQSLMEFHELAHAYQSEDLPELERILTPGGYHAVVANPPYITVKDKTLNQAYRDRYPEVCHMKYSMSVPFIQRLVDLTCPNGFTGQITANSFMKREFGKKLIESYLPKWDLTYVIDTSGAYIPGHGTPTVILFGRTRAPVMPTIRTAMGIAGEPATPDDPANGLVWTAIINQLDQPGSQSRYVSVNDSPREAFHKHPWSIGGGGAAELKEMLDDWNADKLGLRTTAMGFLGITAADDAMMSDASSFRRRTVHPSHRRPVNVGDEIRDWLAIAAEQVLFPYVNESLEQMVATEGRYRWLWPMRAELWSRATFSKRTYRAEGRTWWEWHQVTLDRLRTPMSIVFGEVATHNHFVLDRGGKVFKQTAPVIKLPAEAGEDDHLALLGLLNSSIACFWLKQACFPKGGDHVGTEGARVRRSLWDERFAFNSTNIQQFPLPLGRPLEFARRLDRTAVAYAANLPENVCRRCVPDAPTLIEAWQFADNYMGEMIALQEELDWHCYQLYGLIPETAAKESQFHQQGKKLPAVALGERAFEIVLARQIAAGEVETTWFARHGSKPITEIPSRWPADYRAVVQARIDLIESDKNIALIERPEYKRRWSTDPWKKQEEKALKNWLLDRLESYFDLDGRMNDAKAVTATVNLREPRLTTIAKVSDIARADREFMQVAATYSGRMDFEVGALVGDLILAESVPALPVLRYKTAAIDKRRAWEKTWELQREEDEINAEIGRLDKEWKQAEAEKKPTGLIQSKISQLKSQLPSIPVPPKYTSADFLSGDYWRLRGKLDVPRERWVSFPHCEGEDGTLTIAWAGYDHLQLARAIAERYELAKENEGRKLVPLLAAVGQLIPWLKQWHNELDPAFGTRMGDYFENYLAEEAKALGQSVEQVTAWTSPAKVKAASKKKIPSGAGGFPDSERDILLIAAGLSLVGPGGIAEDLHLDALILMTAPERCRALVSDSRKFDLAIKAIPKEFWTDTAVKWKQIRELLRQANAIEVDVHSGQFSRKEPGFTKLHTQHEKVFDQVSRIALEAARELQTATDKIQREQQAARKREKGAA